MNKNLLLSLLMIVCKTAGMSERGIRYHLTHGKEKGQRRQHVQKDSQSSERSVWDRDDDDIKIALGRFLKGSKIIPSVTNVQ